MPYQYWWPNSWIVTTSIAADPSERPAGQKRVGDAARDERRVLHAARSPSPSSGGIDDGQRLVGVGAEPEAVERERLLGRADVALARALVARLEQQADARPA